MANNGLVVRFFADTRSAVADIGKLERALGRSTTAGEKWQKVGTRMVGALGVAAAAAGALAVKIGVDGVKAAMAEQEELVKLNTALTNMGFASASEDVTRFIDNLQYSVNVSDGELRPAFARLLRSTESITEAQRALGIALDISAATGKDLDTVANGLGKAYDGNAASLGRLGLGLDKTILKSGNMKAITGELAESFGGQASARADTLGGSVRGVQLAWDELQESFGNGVIGSTDNDVKELEKIEAKLRGMQPAAENLGEDVRDLGIGALTFYDRITAMGEAIEKQNWSTAFDMMKAGAQGADDEFDRIIRNFRTLDDIIPGVAMNTAGLNYQTEGLAEVNAAAAEEAENATDALKKQKSAIDKLSSALQTLNGKNRTTAGNRLALRQMRAEGPDAGSDKKLSRDERLDFALQYADRVESLALGLEDQGKTAAARRVLNRGNRYLSGLVGSRTADNFLSTPAYLDRGNKAQRTSGQRMEGVTNIYQFGDIQVQNIEQAIEQARRAERLKALGNGRVAEAARYSAMAGR